MQSPRVHGGSKSDWKLLHADQDLDSFFSKLPDWDGAYPEPILVEM